MSQRLDHRSSLHWKIEVIKTKKSRFYGTFRHSERADIQGLKPPLFKIWMQAPSRIWQSWRILTFICIWWWDVVPYFGFILFLCTLYFLHLCSISALATVIGTDFDILSLRSCALQKTPFPAGLPRLLYLLLLPVKVIVQFITLLWVLLRQIPAPDVFLVQVCH